MKEFVEYLLQFGNLNQQQIDLILKKSKELKLKNNEYFSEAGKVAKQFGFITEGIIRVCYYNDKGEEMTKYFIDENNIVVDLNSFDNSIPSSAYLQAISDCKIIVFSKKDWEELLNTIIGLDNIVRKIISKALLRKVVRLSALVSDDGTTRYLSFMEQYPNLVNRIPLSYVASYLGITQSSLSRIRKNIC
ncbi:MAG: Crp/Fnr family transcriptional regulator [Bacteroidota bacterium]